MAKKQDGVYTEIVKHIQLDRLTDKIKIIPLGDIHRNSSGCDADRFKNFLKRCKLEDDKNTFYLGMGDWDDLASASERQIFANPKLHESSTSSIDLFAQSQVTKLLDETWFMKDKLLGMLQGNHYWRFEEGDTSTERMCKKFGCPWLGAISVVRLCVSWKNTGKKICVDLVASHGKGGGRLLGSPFNSLERMSNIFHNADIYLMGHDHKKGALSKTVLDIQSAPTTDSGIRTRQKRQWFVRTGSFLRGYVPDEQSYITAAHYAPADLGTVKIEVAFNRSQKNGSDIVDKDIHVWS